MPSDRGLGLMESCRLTRDIGSQTSGESNLPRFGALDEVKPLRPACLFLIMMTMSYNGVPNSSAEISARLLSLGLPSSKLLLAKIAKIDCVPRQPLSWPLYRRPGLKSPNRVRLGLQYFLDLIFPY